MDVEGALRRSVLGNCLSRQYWSATLASWAWYKAALSCRGEAVAGTICWACVSGVGIVRSHRNAKGDRLGRCRNCQAMACGTHGHSRCP